MKKILSLIAFCFFAFNSLAQITPDRFPTIPTITNVNAGGDSCILQVYMPARNNGMGGKTFKMPCDSLPSILTRLGMTGGSVDTSIIATKYYVGTVLPDTTHFWNTNGNSGTNSGVNFIGTTDNASLEFRVNDTTAMFIDSSNRHVGIGTVTPDADAMLHVEGLTPLYLHGSIPSVIEGSFSFGLKTTTAANGYDYQNGYVIDNYLNDETYINALEYHGLGNAGAFVQGTWVNSDGSPRSYKKYYPTGHADYGIDTSYQVVYNYDGSSLYIFNGGTFSYADGNEGEHKVLTSDADGYATWQPLNQDTVFVPTTSSTDTLQDGYTGAILDAGATGITGYTLTMPPNPYEGQRILVSLADGTTFGMGYFTVDGNGSPVKANYMMVSHVQYTFRYKNGTWY